MSWGYYYRCEGCRKRKHVREDVNGPRRGDWEDDFPEGWQEQDGDLYCDACKDPLYELERLDPERPATVAVIPVAAKGPIVPHLFPLPSDGSSFAILFPHAGHFKVVATRNIYLRQGDAHVKADEHCCYIAADTPYDIFSNDAGHHNGKDGCIAVMEAKRNDND